MPDAPTTLNGWCELLSDWGHHFITRYGKTVGCAFVKGNEIHCWREPLAEGRWLTRHDITKIIQPIIAAHGHVKTKVINSNLTGQKFVTRLGFYPVSRDSVCTYYKAERLKHERL